MQEISFKMVMERATKNTYRYACVDPNSPVRTVYIEKIAFDGERVPDEIIFAVRGVEPKRARGRGEPT